MRDSASRRALSVSIAATVVALLLSGCFGGKDGPKPTGTEPPKGSIEGRVLDEAGLPMAAADVRALLLNVSAVTDEVGAYRIGDVPAGPLRLTASAPSYVSQTHDLDVAANAVNRVDFQLHPLAQSPEPYHRTVPMTGAVSCSVQQAGGCPDAAAIANNTHHFAVDTGLAGIVIEVQWTPTVAGTAERLRVELRAANSTSCGLPYAEGAGTSPVRLEVAEGFPLHGGHQCLVVSAPPDVTALNQRYDALVTLFFHAPPPQGFTAGDGGG